MRTRRKKRNMERRMKKRSSIRKCLLRQRRLVHQSILREEGLVKLASIKLDLNHKMTTSL